MIRRLLALLVLLVAAVPLFAQSPPLRPGDTVSPGVARQTLYALRDTVRVYEEADERSRVVLRLLRGAEVRAYSETGGWYAVAQGERATGYVSMREVGRSQPPVAVGPAVPATSVDVERLEARLRSVHKQTTFLTVLAGIGIAVSAVSLLAVIGQ